MSNAIHPNREAWLAAAVEELKPWFDEAGHPVRVAVRAAVGFPSARGLSLLKPTIGQCWDATCSADGTCEILINPRLADPLRVLDVLAHELGHAALGSEVGHRKPFPALMKSLGLDGKPTATVAGEIFRERSKPVLERLGPLPHAALTAMGKTKKQSTRMLKVTCIEHEYVARVTRKWLDELGPPLCPACSEPMEIEEKDE